MLRKVVSKTSFLGGEAGYLMEGRSDLAQHQLGCSKLENFIALKGGAVTRRPGTRFVKATENNKLSRVIKYITSYNSGADIFAVEISLYDSTHILFKPIRISDNTEFAVSVNGYNATNLGGGDFAIEVASTIDLDEIQYAQIGETMIITHQSFTPMIFYKTDATPSFGIEPYVGVHGFSNVPQYYSLPYRNSNITSTTLTASATTGTVTITASASFFDSGHVGAHFRHTEAATTGWFRVTAYSSATSVTAVVTATLGGTSGTTDWQEGAWSTYRGFPRTVTFYNQRTVFGGNTSEPDTFWASQSSDYFQMHDVPGSASPADPQSFTLASQSINEIRWMVGGKKLTIGTSRSEWVGVFREDGTNLFLEFNEETTHGSARVMPEKSAYTVPFVQRSKQLLREMVFDFDSDSYVATDLNIFANHIGTAYGDFEDSDVTITQMAFQESPFNVLWVIDSVGRLYGLTRDRQQQVAAWHSHVVGGEDAAVVSICSIPDPSGEKDRLWMVVKRTINSSTVYHLEYMDDVKPQSVVTGGASGDIKAHLDCASLATGSASSTWTGYTRFASDNAYVIAQSTGELVVHSGVLAVNGSGEITLPNSITATKVTVGLHADAEIRPLPFEGGSSPELTMHSNKRADSVAIRMHQTWGLRIGENRINRITGIEENTTFEPIPFDTASTPQLSTFTGVKIIPVPGDSEIDASFTLAMQEPWPCTILSLSPRVVMNEV